LLAFRTEHFEAILWVSLFSLFHVKILFIISSFLVSCPKKISLHLVQNFPIALSNLCRDSTLPFFLFLSCTLSLTFTLASSSSSVSIICLFLIIC
jgi:hypothetical protein